MESQHSTILGRCLTMCPANEIKLREREGLLHKFECGVNFVDGERHNDLDHVTRTLQALELDKQFGRSSNYGGNCHRQPTSNVRNNRTQRKQLQKADINKTIKSFARSAAGLDKTLPEDLRPPEVLENTIRYLFKEILPKANEPYIFIYDFVFDRLRAVRQDLVIQRISNQSAIRILETIVNFHVYSAFRMRNEPTSVFDSHINQKHLIDCLKSLLVLYETNEYFGESRMKFEALYVLLMPSSLNVLSRALSLNFPRSVEFKAALKMSLAYQFKNYASYFKQSKKLSPLLESCLAQHSRELRSKAYQAMTKAYGVKGCKVPLTYVRSVLNYHDVPSVVLDLNHCQIEVIKDETNQQFARFDKNSVARICVDNLTCEFGDANSGCNSMSPNICL